MQCILEFAAFQQSLSIIQLRLSLLIAECKNIFAYYGRGNHVAVKDVHVVSVKRNTYPSLAKKLPAKAPDLSSTKRRWCLTFQFSRFYCKSKTVVIPAMNYLRVAHRRFPRQGVYRMSLSNLAGGKLIEEETISHYKTLQYFPVRIGQTLHNRYTVAVKLGFGGNATVWLCQDNRYE